jgi:hypothetical protein
MRELFERTELRERRDELLVVLPLERILMSELRDEQLQERVLTKALRARAGRGAGCRHPLRHRRPAARGPR